TNTAPAATASPRSPTNNAGNWSNTSSHCDDSKAIAARLTQKKTRSEQRVKIKHFTKCCHDAGIRPDHVFAPRPHREDHWRVLRRVQRTRLRLLGERLSSGDADCVAGRGVGT